MPFVAGTIVGGYEISRKIGQGGMGEVYLAKDAALDRLVAIKTISTRHDDRDELTQRFQREARAAARLIHPNIVQIYRVDIEHDPPYMAMEYVEGRSIERIIAEDGPLSWQRALNVVSQVSSALAAAHAEGIVHRDIKPANIMLGKDNRVKVTDFGLAKLVDSDLKLTSDSRALGSPCYMSPEHCGIGKVGAASDIFSLGVAAYEMITGRLPFEAETAFEMMRRIVSDPLPSLRQSKPDVPAVVDELVSHMAQRTLDKRYASAKELLDDLKALRASQPLIHLSRLRTSDTKAAAPAEIAPRSSSGTAAASLALTTPLPGVAELQLDAPPFGRVSALREASADQRPRRRFAMFAVVLVLILLVGIGSALLALRMNAPAQPNAAGIAPPIAGEQTTPPAGEPPIYPRGLSPQHAPPEGTRERTVWDSVYGRGGKFEGRTSLSAEEVAQLPQITEFGPAPPEGARQLPPPR